jgi:hypothetical protein
MPPVLLIPSFTTSHFPRIQAAPGISAPVVSPNGLCNAGRAG